MVEANMCQRTKQLNDRKIEGNVRRRKVNEAKSKTAFENK
jgi:hypothetical protein